MEDSCLGEDMYNFINAVRKKKDVGLAVPTAREEE